jgi:hypothetical protein
VILERALWPPPVAPESADPLSCSRARAYHCAAIWVLSAARLTCPNWAAQAGVETAQDDTMLAGELRTQCAGHRTSEPFSEATATVALDCQQGRLRKVKEMGLLYG